MTKIAGWAACLTAAETTTQGSDPGDDTRVPSLRAASHPANHLPGSAA